MANFHSMHKAFHKQSYSLVLTLALDLRNYIRWQRSHHRKQHTYLPILHSLILMCQWELPSLLYHRVYRPIQLGQSHPNLQLHLDGLCAQLLELVKFHPQPLLLFLQQRLLQSLHSKFEVVGNIYQAVHTNLPKQCVHWPVSLHRLPASLYFVCV